MLSKKEMFDKEEKRMKKEKKMVEKNSLEHKLVVELEKLYKLNPPVPEKKKQIDELHAQFEKELSAMEDKLFTEMRTIEIMYMRTEIKILKDPLVKDSF